MLEFQPGDIFEGYTVRGALGRGGMGAVYLVHHPRFDTEMALKVMTLEAITDEELETYRARFTREARILVKLRHQAIIRVHAFDEHIDEDGVSPYIVMEFFPGVDGAKWVKTNPSLDRVRNVAIQLADALACAHDAGVIHRDLKHGNILVNDRDEAVLIDFGIAKSEADETVTQTGFSVGTLSHMAPEYLDESKKGRSPQHTVKTDLWAFGCLLYVLTTHRNAFGSSKGAAHLIHLIEDEAHPPLRELRPDASAEWAQVIDDLLQKNPDQRISTAHELKRRLTLVSTTTDPTKPPFVPPVPPGAQRTPSGQSVVEVDHPQPPTASARPKAVQAEDDPFHGAQAQVVPVSEPALDLPPLDGISGVHEPHPGPRVRPAPPTPPPSPPSPPLEPQQAIAETPAPAQPLPVQQPVAPVAKPAEPLAPPPPVAIPQPRPVVVVAHNGESAVLPLPSFAPPIPKAAPKHTAIRSLLLPVGAVGVIVVFGLVALSMLSHAPTAAQLAKPAKQAGEDEALKRAEERANREMTALNEARKNAAPIPVMAAPAKPAPTTTTSTPPPVTVLPSVAPPQPVRASATPAPEPTPAVDPVSARYGNRSFNTGAFGAAQPAGATPTTSTVATAGVKIPVRVDAEIASSPSPVIAIVTKETKVGALTLPAGTQIHGTSNPGQGSRVVVDFRFAIVGGKNVPLVGQALAPDGRAGIPGAHTMGNGTDVAARALGSAVAATADAAATVAGDNVLGAAVRGGGGTAATKAERLNSDENLVVVRRGARFVVYVGG